MPANQPAQVRHSQFDKREWAENELSQPMTKMFKFVLDNASKLQLYFLENNINNNSINNNLDQNKIKQQIK